MDVSRAVPGFGGMAGERCHPGAVSASRFGDGHLRPPLPDGAAEIALEDLHRRSVLADPPLLQPDHARAPIAQRILRMGGEHEDLGAPHHILEPDPRLLNEARIAGEEPFVHQQDLRADRGREREGKADHHSRAVDPHRKIEEGESIPVRLSHVVANSASPEATVAWYQRHLGFALSDTLTHPHMGEMMWFLRINSWHHSLGIALRDHGPVDEAITEFCTAIELDPKKADWHYELGNLLKDKKRLTEAIAQYRLAIDLRIHPLSACVKIGDTESDIAEGLNAGMWTIGVTRSGNTVGLSEEDWSKLDPAEQKKLLACAEQELRAAGALYTAETVAHTLPILDDIAERIANGERPTRVQ